MRYSHVMIVLAVVCAAGIARSQLRAEHEPNAGSEQKPSQQSAAGDEPLLLLDDGPGAVPADASGADNSRCEVCHVNFVIEEMAVVHARKDIGCADCHGECDAHIADESWASGGPGTPPEIMYPPERIDSACEECHETHRAPARMILERWHERCPDKTNPSNIVCTDCHGHHRMNVNLRKASWDKRTGKPIVPAPAPRENSSS